MGKSKVNTMDYWHEINKVKTDRYILKVFNKEFTDRIFWVFNHLM